MKKYYIILLTTLCLLISGCSNTSDDNNFSINSSTTSHTSNVSSKLDINSKDVIEATFERVVDGDTMEIILANGDEVDTRLLLIDTPETKHPDTGVQKFGPEASEFANSVLKKGDKVYFELDGSTQTDKYGRYLGYLWYMCDEHDTLEMYNERVVEEGLARVGYIYSQTKHLDALLKTEKTAKNNKLNIWSINGYSTDEGFNMDVIDNSSNKIETDSSENNSDDNSNLDDSTFVYCNGGSSSSNLYHKSHDSHGMQDAIKMTVKQAENKSYKPCSSCFK